MEWQAVCKDPYFRDAPYKIELNNLGEVVMSPASARHATTQFLIGSMLREYLGGDVGVEYPIKLGASVRVPDVAWMPDGGLMPLDEHGVALKAPDICVEVMSPSNTMPEMDNKMALYFKAGAKEVWLCDEQGALRFFSGPGVEITRSKVAGSFPRNIS
jgi:Uma2 family endonuclease